MITIPIYDLLILSKVTFHFKQDSLEENEITKETAGEDVLFLMLKEQKEKQEMKADDFYPIGVVGRIDHVDDAGDIHIYTKERVNVFDIEVTDQGITASASEFPDIDDYPEEEMKKQFEEMKNSMLKFVRDFPWGIWARGMILQWRNYWEAACALSPYLNLTWEEKYKILEENSRKKKCTLIQQAVYEFMEICRVGEEAECAQKETHENAYRESAIKKQIQILQEELDEMHPENISDIRGFEKKLEHMEMNQIARKEAEKILNRMKQEGQDGHEYGMLYDYLDFITCLSWKNEKWKEIDLDEAESILNEDHYGLKKVKERIIQQLAVMELNKQQSGSILLFVGAPGTGKTSIGQSIAKALHRQYVRISLGGIRDEAEIRGHRRTYVGAMPGRIMEGIKRSGTQNPVMILDEVDKMTRDMNGDPSSALLEVLDPEQNFSFTDHYMNVPYDLSNVFFVCTANTIDTIPEPLLNRMEIINFSGYTPIEKFHIARQHLIPKAMKKMGLTTKNLKVTDQALEKVIEEYTAESGVRGLKKQIERICRYVAVKLVKGEQKSITVNEKRLHEILGNPSMIHEKILPEAVCGVATGLAWTMVGGEILFVETAFTKGEGKIKITGQLGDVMQESAQIAITLVKSMYPEAVDLFKDNDCHIHVPSGAVPKDGPSAGITLVSALSSLVTKKMISPEVGMTGEVSLRGGVLPIGGLPEKLMAAQRAGIKTVLIPWDNREDLEEVADEVKKQLRIIPVKTVKEVLEYVL